MARKYFDGSLEYFNIDFSCISVHRGTIREMDAQYARSTVRKDRPSRMNTCVGTSNTANKVIVFLSGIMNFAWNIIVDSVCLSVCLSISLSLSFDRSFCDRAEFIKQGKIWNAIFRGEFHLVWYMVKGTFSCTKVYASCNIKTNFFF